MTYNIIMSTFLQKIFLRYKAKVAFSSQGTVSNFLNSEQKIVMLKKES